ncbi:MAG TPA: hypothetical protein VJ741_13210 [Solirubrobacteraceae bacterium]|nr:hypothetical protein [Solirubrobacteraceae bacterium]
MVGGDVVLEDLAHGEHALAHEVVPGRGVDAVIAHLLNVPSMPNDQVEATAGHEVDAGRRLRGGDRIALGHLDDRRLKPQTGGRGRPRGERDEQVECSRVRHRQIASRVRRLPARWDVGVLTHRHRIEAGVLDELRSLAGQHRLVCEDRVDRDLHHIVLRASVEHRHAPKRTRGAEH